MNVHFSSQRDDWATPQKFYDLLDAEFQFTLDPCALPCSAKCKTYYTPEDNGLEQDWGGNHVFMNPPYGRVIGDWVRKACVESRKPDTLVVGLIPSRTDTCYWHRYIFGKAREIRFVKGRLKFGGAENSAPFPSAVIVWDGMETGKTSLSTMLRPQDLEVK